MALLWKNFGHFRKKKHVAPFQLIVSSRQRIVAFIPRRPAFTVISVARRQDSCHGNSGELLRAGLEAGQAGFELHRVYGQVRWKMRYTSYSNEVKLEGSMRRLQWQKKKKRKGKNTSKRHNEGYCNCFYQFKRRKPDNQWVLEKMHNQHNHPLAKLLSTYAAHRKNGWTIGACFTTLEQNAINKAIVDTINARYPDIQIIARISPIFIDVLMDWHTATPKICENSSWNWNQLDTISHIKLTTKVM